MATIQSIVLHLDTINLSLVKPFRIGKDMYCGHLRSPLGQTQTKLNAPLIIAHPSPWAEIRPLPAICDSICQYMCYTTWYTMVYLHTISGWWLYTHPVLKNMSSSIGMMTETQYFWENSKFMATSHHQPDIIQYYTHHILVQAKHIFQLLRQSHPIIPNHPIIPPRCRPYDILWRWLRGLSRVSWGGSRVAQELQMVSFMENIPWKLPISVDDFAQESPTVGKLFQTVLLDQEEMSVSSITIHPEYIHISAPAHISNQ